MESPLSGGLSVTLDKDCIIKIQVLLQESTATAGDISQDIFMNVV